MQSYQLYIDDDRYTVPTLVIVDVASEGRARARATEYLLQSPHHLSIEVFSASRSLFTVKPPRRQSPAPADAPGFL